MKENFKHQSIQKRHKDAFDMEVPDGYFLENKQQLLSSLQEDDATKNKSKRIWFNFSYPIAASIAILIGLFIWFNPMQQQQIEESSLIASLQTEDALVESLFLDSHEVNTYFEGVIVSDIESVTEVHPDDIIEDLLFEFDEYDSLLIG